MHDDKADRGSPRGTGRVDTVNVALPQSFHFFYQKYQDFFNFIFHRHHKSFPQVHLEK